MNIDALNRQFSYDKGWNLMQLYAHQSMMIEYMCKNNVDQHFLSILYALNEDIQKRRISICYVCGDKHHDDQTTMMDNEHIVIKNNWGYLSDFDYEEHTLTLCSPCYKKHIMEGFLGKFVNVKEYH